MVFSPPIEKPKKKPLRFLDHCFLGCLICGGLPLLVSMIPPVYWRVAQESPELGLRFPNKRLMSPLTISDSMGKGVMWSSLHRVTCEKSRLYNDPDPMTAISSMAAEEVPKASELGGCAIWGACKTHMIDRCNTYYSFHMMGRLFMILCGLSMFFAMFSSFLLNIEQSQHQDTLIGSQQQVGVMTVKFKSREDKEKEAKTKTVMASGCSFFLSLSAVGTWITATTTGLQTLRKRSFYPYLYLQGPGVFLAVFGVFCFLCALIAGLVRRFQKFDDGGVPDVPAVAPAAGDTDPSGAPLPPYAGGLLEPTPGQPPPPLVF